MLKGGTRGDFTSFFVFLFLYDLNCLLLSVLLSAREEKDSGHFRKIRTHSTAPLVAGRVGAGVVGRVSAPDLHQGSQTLPGSRAIWDEDCRVKRWFLAHTLLTYFKGKSAG